jgi:hypothetical protein
MMRKLLKSGAGPALRRFWFQLTEIAATMDFKRSQGAQIGAVRRAPSTAKKEQSIGRRDRSDN